MEFGKEVSNPMLVGMIEMMKEDPSEDNRQMFIDELVKCEFMAPVNLVPAPVKNAEGRWVVDPNVQFQFPLLKTIDEGVEYFMAFTDRSEYEKWEKVNRPSAHFAVRISDYAEMLFTTDANNQQTGAQGLVINPFGANIVLPRTMMAGLLITKLPELQNKIVEFRKKNGLNED